MATLQFDKKQMDDFAARYNIQLIVLFGSFVRDENKSQSDVDIAVMLDQSVAINSNERLSMIVDLHALFPSQSDIDVTILNTASSLLKYEVAMEGRLIYQRCEDVFDDFRIKSMKYYEDERKFDAEYEGILSDYLTERQ